MEKIAVYNMSRLQSIFEMAGPHKEFLFVGQDRYTPSTDEPFRTDNYAIAFLQQGSLRVATGLHSLIVHGPALLTIGPSIIRTIEKAGDVPRVDLIFFREDFFLEGQANAQSLLKFTFFDDEHSHVLNLPPDSAEKTGAIFTLLKTAIGHNHPHESTLVRNYIYILLCEADALYSREPAGQMTSSVRIPPLLANFKNLLARQALQQRSVRYYADALHVTPKYLSEYIKAQTGRTAGEWIDQMVVLEAKVLLQHKDLSIAQIADRLNFSDQSVFGKFFKVNTGLSPLYYRNSIL